MKRFAVICGFLFTIMLASMLLTWQSATAARSGQTSTSIPRGGALYDNWFAAAGKQPPSGNMPVWSRQTTNTRSGADTWRCVTCHGWDYQGKDGAYRAGSNYTGFPNLFLAVQTLSQEQIIDQLSGKRDPAHNFSPYIDAASLTDLAIFLKQALIDDNQYINPNTLEVISGDALNGRMLYTNTCATCHGDDGVKIKFRFEGLDAGLGTLAALDPWRFLHKTRFGTPGTAMPIGFTLGWKPQEGRDVLAYAQQTFKTGQEEPTSRPAISGVPPTSQVNPGGPAQDWFTGLLTAFGVAATGIGFAILLGVVLVGIIFAVVWFMRSDRK